MSIDARLHRVMPTLTAKERGILVLESWKEGRQEDPAWRRTMPNEQVNEFNRYIDLMNGANVRLASYISVLELLVEKVELRQCWFVTLRLWSEQLDLVTHAARAALQEPVTQSAYEALVEKGKTEWVPVEELAAMLAGDQFQEPADDGAGEAEDDDAWNRAIDEQEKLLRRLVAAGELPQRGRGRKMKTQVGAFNARFGRTDTAAPGDLIRFRVLPDEQEDAVLGERTRIQHLKDDLEWEKIEAEGDHARLVDKLGNGIGDVTARSLDACWKQLRAAEVVAEEMTAAFNGMDALKPEHRESMDALRTKLMQLSEELGWLGYKPELPEPDEEGLEVLRRLTRFG